MLFLLVLVLAIPALHVLRVDVLSAPRVLDLGVLWRTLNMVLPEAYVPYFQFRDSSFRQCRIPVRAALKFQTGWLLLP